MAHVRGSGAMMYEIVREDLAKQVSSPTGNI